MSSVAHVPKDCRANRWLAHAASATNEQRPNLPHGGLSIASQMVEFMTEGFFSRLNRET